MKEIVKIEEINTYRDDYLYYYDTWLTLSDFREGAPAVKQAVWKYLPKRVAEDDDVYAARLQNLTFTPVASKAIRTFVTTLNSAPLALRCQSDESFWNEFSQNIDGNNGSDRSWLVGTLSSLLYFGRVFSVVSLPKVNELARSLYEREKINVIPVVTNYEPLDVIDYVSHEWYKIRQLVTRSSPLGGKQRFLQYHIYDKTAHYVYEAEVKTQALNAFTFRPIPEYSDVSYDSITQIKQDGQWVGFSSQSLVKLKSVEYHNAGIPPVVECVLKPELWTGKDVYSKQHQYLKIESSYTESGEYAGTLVRIFTPTAPAPMNDPRSYTEPQDYSELVPNNHNVLIGANYQIVESTGAAIGNLESQLNKIEDQIKSIVNLDYSSAGDSASAKRQSGDAKDYDRDLWESCVKTYGDTMRRHYQLVAMVSSVMAGKKPPEVTGLDSFRVNNSNELLDQTAKLPVDLPPTARRLWTERLISVLLGNLSDEDKESIKQELNDKQTREESLDPVVQDVIDIPGMTSKDVGQVLRGGLGSLEDTKQAKTSKDTVK
jgi:hypothetical protein